MQNINGHMFIISINGFNLKILYIYIWYYYMLYKQNFKLCKDVKNIIGYELIDTKNVNIILKHIFVIN